MPRLKFGGSVSDWGMVPGEESVLRVTPGTEITLWDSRVGGDQVTDILDESEAELENLVVDDNGQIPTFLGPDDETTEQLWVEHPDWPERFVIVPKRYISEQYQNVLELKFDYDGSDIHEIEDHVSSLQSDFSDTESDISDFEQRLDDLDGDIEDLKPELEIGEVVFHARRSTSLNISSQTFHNIGLTDASVNKIGWSSGFNTLSLEVPGKYLIVGSVGFQGNSAGSHRMALIQKNGNDVDANGHRHFINSAAQTRTTCGPVLVESDGTDVVRLVAYQNSTVTIPTSITGTFQPSIWIMYVGP